MAQHDYVIANGTGAAVRSDINNGLAAIVSNNSGTSEPATMYAYQWWADTTTGLLKIRNAANNAWVTVGTLADANLGLLTSGSTLTAALGSASTPGITFTGDLNTGIFSPGADQVAISTNGTGRLFVDSSGRALVGTSTTYTDVIGGSGGYSGPLWLATNGSTDTGPFISTWTNSASLDSMGTSIVLSRSKGNSIGTHGILADGNGIGTISFNGSDGSKFVSGAIIRAAIDGTPGANDLPTRLVFSTTADAASSPTERMRIDSSGTTTLTSASATAPFIAKISTSEVARIDSSGRLLVGTSTARTDIMGAGAQLQVEGTTFATSRLGVTVNRTDAQGGSIYLAKSRSASIGGVTVVNSDDNLGDIEWGGSDGSTIQTAARISCRVDATPGANDMPGRLVFSTTADGASSPTERMRITSDGGLLVNRTSRFTTAAKVEIEGSGAATTAALPLAINDSLGTASGSSYSVVFYRVGIIVGSITTTASATAFNTSSDYRLKENLVPLTGAIDRLQQIPVHRFNFIADPDKTVDGFLAHEAQEIVPECVTGEKDAVDDDGNPVYQGIDQSKLVPLLTAALQEAIAKIETLEAKVAALEAQ